MGWRRAVGRRPVPALGARLLNGRAVFFTRCVIIEAHEDALGLGCGCCGSIE